MVIMYATPRNYQQHQKKPCTCIYTVTDQHITIYTRYSTLLALVHAFDKYTVLSRPLHATYQLIHYTTDLIIVFNQVMLKPS